MHDDDLQESRNPSASDYGTDPQSNARSQAGRTRRGAGGINLTRFDRWAYVAGGLGLVALGLRRGLLGKVALGGTGAWLLQQAYSGRNPMFQALGIRVNQRPEDHAARETIVVEESISINKPREEVYRFWRDVTNLPRFMRNIEWVNAAGDKHSRWCGHSPIGGTFEWDSEITRDEPGRELRWRGTVEGRLLHFGRVRFEDAYGDRGTQVRVRFEYVPVGGSIGTAITRAMGREPQPEMKEDLRRLKQCLETGELSTTEGQTSGAGNGARRSSSGESAKASGAYAG